MKPIDKYFPILQKALDQHKKNEPNWQIVVFATILKQGFKSLKHYIEDVRDSEISWDNPIVNLHFPVGWNWKMGDPQGKKTPGGHIFGKITAGNTASKKLVQKTLAGIFVNFCEATVLANATNWVWYQKINNYFTPVLPIELSKELDEIKNKTKRRERFEEFIRPFSLGCGRMEFPEWTLKSGTAVTKKTRRQLAKIHALMDIKSLSASGEINGKKFRCWLVFEIQPMIADYDKKKAYHPLTVGLAFATHMEGGKITEESPALWPQDDREKFWEGLFRELEKLKVDLVSQTKKGESIVLPVTSKVKIPEEWWTPEKRSTTIKLLADVHGSVGEIVEFAIGQPEKVLDVPRRSPCGICGRIHDPTFTQFVIDRDKVIYLGGVLPDIIAVVHHAHARGLPAISTKDGEILKVCGRYNHPCKAFGDLKHGKDYKILFVRRRGFISLRRISGIGSEVNSEYNS